MAAAHRMLAVIAVLALVILSAARPGATPQFYDWSLPVNIGPPINTALAETAPFISRDGRSLYFVRPAAAGGFGGMDIWVSQRARIDDAWGPAQNLGPTINTPFNDFGPSLSPDGHILFFASDRPGFGGNDLYISRRHNKRSDFGWQPSVNLGDTINTAANEIAAVYFEDDLTGVITLYFASNRPGGFGGDDIYASTLLLDETFGAPILVEELSTPSSDLQPAIRRDGLEMFLSSSRPGTLGSLDLWVSTRGCTTDPWSVPMNLGALVNSMGADARASLSFDGTELYFQSNRDGNAEVYRSTRSRLRGVERERRPAADAWRSLWRPPGRHGCTKEGHRNP
jgi:Tol biopolymer transport system component